MKTLRLLAVLILTCASALAWNCPAGQVRQQAPPNTPTTTPYYDVVEGIAFICVPTPTADPKGNPVSATSTSNSNSTSTSGATATGGNSSSTANGGSSTSTSGVKNSGNSSNTNNNTAQGGAGGNASQTQSQSNTSTNNNASTATGNGDNSNNSVTNVAASKIPVSTAYAPTALPSAPCVKGFGAGIQTMPIGGSFGGSKVDTGCDDRETARAYALLGSRLAACKTLVYGKRNAKIAKKHPEQAVTVEDCMQQDEQQAAVVAPSVPQPSPVTPVAITVQTPPAQVVVLHEEITVTATRAQVRAAEVQHSVKPVVKKRTVPKPCVVPKSLLAPMEEK